MAESVPSGPAGLQARTRGLPWNAKVQAAGVAEEVAALREYLPRQVQRRTVQLADQPHLRTDGVRVAGSRLAPPQTRFSNTYDGSRMLLTTTSRSPSPSRSAMLMPRPLRLLPSPHSIAT